MQTEAELKERLAALRANTQRAIAEGKQAWVRLGEEISHLKSLQSGTERDVKRDERRLWAAEALERVLLSWPEEIEAAVENLHALRFHLGSDSITVAKQRELLQAELEARRELERACPHTFVLHFAGHPSYNSYEDGTPARRNCLTCGLEESGGTGGESFKTLDDRQGRMVLVGYRECEARQAIPDRQLRKAQVFAVLLANPDIHRVCEALTETEPPTVRKAT